MDVPSSEGEAPEATQPGQDQDPYVPSIRDSLRPVSLTSGRAHVNHYGAHGDDHEAMRQEARETRAREEERFRERVAAFYARKSPRVEFQGAILKKKAFQYKEDIKDLGGLWKEAAKYWVLMPVDPSRSSEVQVRLDELKGRGVEVTWVGGPDLPAKDLEALLKGVVQVELNPALGEEQALAALGTLAEDMGYRAAWGVLNPTERACYLGTVKNRPLHVTLPGLAVEAFQTRAPQDEARPAGTPAPKPVPDEPKAEDPWKKSPWARINLGPFQERLLTEGAKGRILGAAHFKAFLWMVTLMDEWNLVHETQGEMAAAVRVKASRFSEVVRNLEELGFIQKLDGRTKRARIRVDPRLLVRTGPAMHAKILHDWDAWARERVLKEAGIKVPRTRRKTGQAGTGRPGMGNDGTLDPHP